MINQENEVKNQVTVNDKLIIKNDITMKDELGSQPNHAFQEDIQVK